MGFPANPLINGHYPDYSRIAFVIGGIRNFPLIKEINYSDSCEPGEVRANQQQRLGITPGEYKCEGNVKLYKRALDELLRTLGDGFYLQRFPIIVSYDMDDQQGLITDTIAGCRLKKIGQAHKQGNDALECDVDLDISYILWNGRKPLTPMRL